MPSEHAYLISRSPVMLTVAGVDVCIPFSPAARWLEAMDDPRSLAFALADRPSQERLLEALVTVPGAEQALYAQSYALLARSTGRARWWEGARLANSGAAPEILGRLVLAGVDPYARTIGEWCAAMYTVATQNSDETGQIRFEMQLAFPPAGFEDQWDDGEDYDQMMAGFRDLPGMD